eukprot:PhM_4_TR1250/c0_g1_i5/m.81139
MTHNLYDYKFNKFTEKLMILLDKDEVEQRAKLRSHSSQPQRVQRRVPLDENRTTYIPISYKAEKEFMTRRSQSSLANNNKMPIILDLNKHNKKKKKPHHLVPIGEEGRQVDPSPERDCHNNQLLPASPQHRSVSVFSTNNKSSLPSNSRVFAETELQKAAKRLYKKSWLSPALEEQRNDLEDKQIVARQLNKLKPKTNHQNAIQSEVEVFIGTTSIDTFHHRHFLKREEDKKRQIEEDERHKVEAREAARLAQIQQQAKVAEKKHQARLHHFTRLLNMLSEERRVHDQSLGSELMSPNLISPNIYESIGSLETPLMIGQEIEVRSHHFVQSFFNANDQVVLEDGLLRACGCKAWVVEVLPLESSIDEREVQKVRILVKGAKKKKQTNKIPKTGGNTSPPVQRSKSSNHMNNNNNNKNTSPGLSRAASTVKKGILAPSSSSTSKPLSSFRQTTKTTSKNQQHKVQVKVPSSTTANNNSQGSSPLSPIHPFPTEEIGLLEETLNDETLSIPFDNHSQVMKEDDYEIMDVPSECVIPSNLSCSGSPPAPMILSDKGGIFRLANMTLQTEMLGEYLHVHHKMTWKPPMIHHYNNDDNNNESTSSAVCSIAYIQPLRSHLQITSISGGIGDRQFRSIVLPDKET